MELKYTPRAVFEIEMDGKRPMQDMLAEFSMKTILIFVKRGLGVNQDEAEKEIEKYLSEGHDTTELYLYIMEKLQGAGFLPKQIDLKKTREEMNKGMQSI